MRNQKTEGTRIERDGIGELALPADAYYGIHTLRAVRNFPFSGYRLHPAFIRSFAQVEQACARTNALLGYLPGERGWAVIDACAEIADGALADQIVEAGTAPAETVKRLLSPGEFKEVSTP